MRIVSLAIAAFLAVLGIVFVVMIPIVITYAPAWRLALVVLIALAAFAGAVVIYWLVEIRDVLARRA